MNNLIGQPVEALDTPVPLIHLDALDRNIEKMSSTIIKEAGVGWRPHTKAMKNPDLVRLCLDAGAHGITCAKLGEAEVMAAAGIGDILVANEIVGAAKISRLVKICQTANVMVCVDNIDNVREIDRAAGAIGVRPRVLVEIDVGMARAGVEPGKPALKLSGEIAELSNVELVGLQTWESHTLTIEDPAEKKRQVLSALALLTGTADRIREAGITLDIISCGGTGTYWISAFAPGITEVEAGGGIYGCVRYRRDFGVEVEPALTILSTVTSRPDPARIICDAGFKTTGRGFADPEVIDCGDVTSFSFSAEHGRLTLSQENRSLRPGDQIQFVPGYSDATVFLHDYLYGVRDGRVEAVWPVVGRGKLQ
ncbi:MAG: DSD1 family PLP-dependent enzyme [Pseudomonadota bacterium]|jgi:D-serine deaminase-like pyridoxal phosphate-dependent protein|nr:DSD1 family PLP-dependent enzyme [Pseudomonadota bacterium]